jgi:hypothetical protein
VEPIPHNIQRFNLTVLVLFDKLYNAFPTPIEIDAMKLGESVVPEEADEGQAFDFGTEAHNVVTWLRQEDFIRYDDGSGFQNTFYQVVLTSKGLTALQRVPSSISPGQPKEPIINKIKKIVGSGVKSAGADAVKRVVSEVLEATISVAG